MIEPYRSILFDIGSAGADLPLLFDMTHNNADMPMR
jgi:hypothetical protein